MSQSITEFLNLKEEEVESIEVVTVGKELIVTLTLKSIPHICPQCGHITSKVKGYYQRVINHGLFIYRACIVHYNQRRYKCVLCNHSFNERNNFASKHKKKSLASLLQIMELAKDPHMTFTAIADLLHLSTTTVIETFYQNVPDFPKELPRTLCIDEVYLGRNATKKYVAVLLDFETNKIVDIIYGRTKDALHSYFQLKSKEQLRKVEYLSSDMYDGFRFLQRHYFPDALMCTDSFHVIQLILSMFDSLLKSLMRKYEEDSLEYYLLKKKRSILLKNESSLQWYEQEYNRKFNQYMYLMNYREKLFQISPIIKEVYHLKEAYISLNRLPNKQIAQEQFDELVPKFVHHSNKDVRRVGRSLLKWRKEILNSFTWINGRRISNGPIESRNKTIKLLITNAAGYHNFEHLRNRSIYCINSMKKKR